MAVVVSYNTAPANFSNIVRATNSGTTFTNITPSTTAWDYFDDNANVNDAIYFGLAAPFSDVIFNIGTPMNGTLTLVWEYFRQTVGWTPVENMVDETSGLTATGLKRVKFPFQLYWTLVTVNAVVVLWVRCRIQSKTSITEGGANTGVSVKKDNGTISIVGGTDAVPATFTDVYNYMQANYPYVGVTKYNNYFDFRRVLLNVASRLLSTLETVEIGIGSPSNVAAGTHNFSFVTSGIKVGTDAGKRGSVFILNYLTNQSPITFAPTSKFYGTVFKSGKYLGDSNLIPGYPVPQGEWLDCFTELVFNNVGTVDSVMKKTRVLTTLGMLLGSNTPTPMTGVRVISIGSTMFYCYRNSLTLTDFDYAFELATGAAMFYLYQMLTQDNPPIINLVNPVTPMPTMSTPNKACANGSLNALENWAKVWYYTASAGTYTDITTEASSGTANDINLDGEVGDIIYMGALLVSVNGMAFYLNRTTGTNDYVYAVEHYRSGVWTAPQVFYDQTDNLSKTGSMFNNADSAYFSSVAINGFTASWTRIRIVSKGTGIQKANQLRRAYATIASEWRINEKYTFDLTITDKNDTNIQNAQIVLKDSDNQLIYSGMTDGSGNIPQQLLLSKQYRFDPVGTPSTTIGEKIYDKATLIVNKTGFEQYEGFIDIRKQIQTLSLIEQNPVITSVDIQNPTADNNDGVIIINTSGGTPAYQYSIGAGYQTGNTFTGLSGDTYIVSVKDSLDLQNNISGITLTAPAFSKPLINSIDITNPSVDNNDGIITIYVSGGTSPYEYSIGSGYQTGNTFSGLSGGTYSVSVMDINNQSDGISGIELVADIPIIPKINSVIITDSKSTIESTGSIKILISGGTSPYLYKLNDGNYQISNTFTGLPANTYNITIKDSLNQIIALSGIKVGATTIGGASGRGWNRRKYTPEVNVKNISIKDKDNDLKEEIKIRVTL